MSEQTMVLQQDEETEIPYVVFVIEQNQYALLCTHISYITQIPEITELPQSASYLRGISMIAGEVIPMVDARAFFQQQTLRDELRAFEGMIDLREQDHRKWMDSFKQSVEKQTEIKVTADPHACAFGKWYDSYRPTNAWVAYQLKKIEEPHTRLHRSVDRVCACSVETEEGRQQTAEILKEAEYELMPSILSALEDCKRAVLAGTREMTLVLFVPGDAKVGLVVDAVNCVTKLEEDLETRTMQALRQGKYIEGIKQYEGKTVLVLGDILLDELSGVTEIVS